MDAGYAFRSQPDGRNHGAAAAAYLDIPLPGPFALRPEGLLLGFGGLDAAPSPLGLFAGALSLVYSFDDTDVQALAAVGPLAGVSVAGGPPELRAGALASLGLRLPVADFAGLEARVALPLVLYGPKGLSLPGQPAFADGSPVDFPLQTAFFIGATFDLGRLAGP